MRLHRAAIAMCPVILAGWAVTWAAADTLPPLTGELSGGIALLKLPGAPTLDWKLVLREGGESVERIADLVLSAPGVSLQGEARLQALDRGTWRLAESRVDVGPWFAIITRSLDLDAADWSAEGALRVTGAGEIRPDAIAGRLQFELHDGTLRNSTHGWSVEGIAMRGALGLPPGIASDGPMLVRFREAAGFGLTARDGEIEFSLDRDGRVHVARAASQLMEGRVALAPFEFRLGQPASTEVRFDGVQLGQLAGVLPPVLASAEGRVTGAMTLSWSAADGVRPGAGRLQIDPGQSASLRLAPAPGFLTSRVPRKLTLLPAWLGPLARAFSPENPAYETLRAIEMGKMRLEVQSLEIGLRPEGDAAGRTARVVVQARPARGDVVDSVRFEVNVSGPLVDVLRLGLEGKVNVRAH